MAGKKGTIAWNKGKKFPHSPEWEEKRLLAVREAYKKKVCPKGYTRPPSAIRPMLDVLAKRMAADPEKYRQIAIRNLSRSKSLSLASENSPQWKGGITENSQKWKSSRGKEFEQWRKVVYARDGGKCKVCGSKTKLSAHHIVPSSEYHCFAFLPMNGVLLCEKCHKQTKSFGGKQRPKDLKLGKTMVHMETVPCVYQAYPTVGNWNYGTNGEVLVFVSEMGNEDTEFLVGLHEWFEAVLCKKAGITAEIVDEWDFHHPGPGNPADDANAPYHQQHEAAMILEKLAAYLMGRDWNEHEESIDRAAVAVDALFAKEKPHDA